ncbi:5'-nucleotidase [Deinobacterium chartae]|uniref:5'-nucleotidase n=1 Tax=Deinobacterium chartae TaxID=521158 RepID=A0A841HZB8_9DEIO|nr:5'-nucleotidase C-terminal domain-containing protein [Deinobacterium chartae]MBB6098283.1 5'-nucleotidase [Deinobacterium chartae]
MRFPVLTSFLFASGLIGSSFASAAGVSLLYFNDAHEIAPVDKGIRGGAARLRTLVNQVRAGQPDTLVVFGGDLAGGTLFGEFRGEPMVEALNLIGVDLANFGQHEFDFGAAQARKLVAQSKFPWITSNLTEKDGTPFNRLPTRWIKEIGGMKLGFFGLTTAMDTSSAGAEVVQADTLEAARREVAALQAERVDFIVAVTQQPVADDLNLAAKVPGIDIILSEEESETVTQISTVGRTVVAKPAGNITSVVRIDLLKKGEPVRVSVLAVDERVPEEPEVAALARKYMDELDRRLGETVITTTVPLDAGASNSRVGETALGNLIADAFRAALKADVAIMQGGGIRSDRVYPAGPLTLKNLTEILPFGNQVVLLEVDGATLQAALENGVSQVDKLSGRFPQVSGMTYAFDPKAPVGARVSQVTVGGQPLDRSKTYRLAVGSFLAAGGDGYGVLTGARMLVPATNGVRDVVALADYLRANPQVTPRVEGRILKR